MYRLTEPARPTVTGSPSSITLSEEDLWTASVFTPLEIMAGRQAYSLPTLRHREIRSRFDLVLRHSCDGGLCRRQHASIRMMGGLTEVGPPRPDS